MQYSAKVANFFTPNDLEPEGDWHPRIKDSVYWGKFYHFMSAYHLLEVHCTLSFQSRNGVQKHQYACTAGLRAQILFQAGFNQYDPL